MKEILKESIKMHYDNKDYTEVVRDGILCLMNEIRAKSDLQDTDGVELINKAFSEKNPLIKINKMQTQTEKNKHKGIMNLSKGLVEYFRNPMSHNKQDYSKEIADAILVLIDKVILEEIIQSKSLNSLEELYNEIVSDLTPNTERYAKNLVKTIPENKMYELVVLLYKNREDIKNEKKNIIIELVKKLKEDEFVDYCNVIEGDLYGKCKSEEMVSILRFISKEVWEKLSELSRIKIEDMSLEDAKKCEVYGARNNVEIIQNGGNIIIGAKHLIDKFSNKKEIIDCLYEKIISAKDDEYNFDFLVENFLEVIVSEKEPNYEIIQTVSSRLNYSFIPAWYDHFKNTIRNLPKTNLWYKNFSGMLHIFEATDDLPF